MMPRKTATLTATRLRPLALVPLMLLSSTSRHVVIFGGSAAPPSGDNNCGNGHARRLLPAPAPTSSSSPLSPRGGGGVVGPLLPGPDPNVDWDAFDFSLNGVRTDAMWLDQIDMGGDGEGEGGGGDGPSLYSSDAGKCLVVRGTGGGGGDGEAGDEEEEGEDVSILLHPAATVLNYGQSLFEGLKAFRRPDGTVALFRPSMNAARMASGARRLLIPPVSEEAFVAACEAVVRANARWIPPAGKGALYLRPILFGSGAGLGVKPSHQYTFCVYCSPVGDYFGGKGGGGSGPNWRRMLWGLVGGGASGGDAGEARPIRLRATRAYSRAAPGGSGGVKAGGNYAPCFLAQREVRSEGYDEALFLDAVSGEAVEEAGASNFFAVYPNNTIVTPHLGGTILPGITRDSVVELARSDRCGCTVLERRLTVSDLRGASEAFCCGTGASITPVGAVTVDVVGGDGEKEGEEEIVFGDGGRTMGPRTRMLQRLLLDVQMGTADDAVNAMYSKWIHVVHGEEE